jgi:L-cysteine:1D-myo-inositol 2-amino-2-deoxy-alpha-D-glucopyranoside ligase
MAIRLALLAHHYRSDWEWTDAVLTEARSRLTRWRAATSGVAALSGKPAVTAPSAEAVLRTVRERLADDLDAPGALTAIDGWADAVLAAPAGPASAEAGEAGEAARLIRDTADALLGIAL